MNFIPSPAALEAARRLREAGFEAVYVGGCVRDACMGVSPHDFDLATSAYPAEMLSVFAGLRVLTTGIRHGTLTVLFDREPVEITSYRADGAYSDGRRPDTVRFSRSLDDDLQRRDFTVNALAVGADGALIDRFGGLHDLQSKTLRAIGSPDERFREDALRILRALRFAARLGFSIEPATAASLLRNSPLLPKLSAERVASELFSLLPAKDAPRVLSEYRAVLFTVLPEVDPGSFDAALAELSRLPEDAALRLSRLLLPAGEEKAGQALDRLGVSNRIRRRVLCVVKNAGEPLPVSRAGMLRLLSRLGEPAVRDLSALQRAHGASPDAEALLTRLLGERPCLTLSSLAVKGGDLLEAGLAPGREIGDALRFLLDAVLDSRAPNEKQALLSLLQARRKM